MAAGALLSLVIPSLTMCRRADVQAMPAADFRQMDCLENSKNICLRNEAADIKTMVCEGL